MAYSESFQEIREANSMLAYGKITHNGFSTCFGIPVSHWRAVMRLAGANDAVLNLETGEIIPIVRGRSNIPVVPRQQKGEGDG